MASVSPSDTHHDTTDDQCSSSVGHAADALRDLVCQSHGCHGGIVVRFDVVELVMRRVRHTGHIIAQTSDESARSLWSHMGRNAVAS